MSRGRRFDSEPKLNMTKVFGVIMAFVVIILIIVSIVKLLNQDKENGELSTQTYFSIYDNEKWGIINHEGKIIIEPTYEEMIIVPNQTKDVFVTAYDINDETGEYKTKALNSKGEEILTGYQLVEVIDNSDNNNIWYEQEALKAKKNDKYGLINLNGKEILNFEYDSIKAIKGIEKYFLIKKGENVGIANNVGQIIINPEYKEISILSEDCTNAFKVKNKDDRYGIISINKEIIATCEYEDAKYVDNDTIFAVKKDNKWGLIENNKIILNNEYESIEQVHNGEVIIKKDNKFGVINTEKKEIIPFNYEDMKFIAQNKYIAKKDNKYGIINNENKELIGFEHKFIVYRKNVNLVEIQKDDINTIVYDSNLENKVEGILSEVNPEKGYIKMRVGEEYKFYNLKLEEKKNTDLFNATLYLDKKDGKYGYINKSGEVLVDYTFDDATEQNKYGYSAVKKDGKWGVIDKIGKIILEPTVNLDNSIFVQFIGQWHLDDSGIYYTK